MSATEAFFDTNIVGYFASADAVKAKRSSELLRAGGFVSVQVLNEFASLARRKHALPWSNVRTVLAAVRSTCTVASLTTTTHEVGLALAERYQLNVYDGMIVAAAQLAGCTVLYSEDMQDGLVIDGLTIRNPYAASAG
jgi:predicted nucleic acid-binding protein